jgi:hypothetical protein
MAGRTLMTVFLTLVSMLSPLEPPLAEPLEPLAGTQVLSLAMDLLLALATTMGKKEKKVLVLLWVWLLLLAETSKFFEFELSKRELKE